jgi:hypothetical protein
MSPESPHLTLAELAAGETPGSVPATAAAHLAACPLCRARSQALPADGVRLLASRCQPSPALIHRVLAAATDEQAAQPRRSRLPGRSRAGGRRVTRAHPPRRPRVILAGAGLAAAAAGTAVAVALATAAGEAPGPAGPVMLTAAMIQQVSSATRTAMAHSAHATVTYRTVTGGIPQFSNTSDITLAGKNWNYAYSQTFLAAGPSPTRTFSDVQRIVGGQAYERGQVHGQQRWIQDPAPEGVAVPPDPRNALGLLDRSAQFQAVGYQTIGGTRLRVLRAAHPGRLTSNDVLPNAFPPHSAHEAVPGQPISGLELWVDRHQVVHRMLITYRARGEYTLTTPTSKAAGQAYQRAERALRAFIGKRGKRNNERFNRANLRAHQALLRAYPVHHGTRVTTVTVTFLDIGHVQHVTRPAQVVPYCVINKTC